MPPASTSVAELDNGPVVLGFDIGGTNLRLGLVTPDNRLIEPHKTESSPLFAGADPMHRFGDYLAAYLAGALGGRTLCAISGGFPSTVSANRRTVISTTNIPALQNLLVADDLARFGVPVVVDRDTNNLLRFDLADHQLPRSGIVIGCYIGTGLGNAIAINGRMLVGRHGVAGELGHVPVHGNSRICGCGNRGCVETVQSQGGAGHRCALPSGSDGGADVAAPSRNDGDGTARMGHVRVLRGWVMSVKRGVSARIDADTGGHCARVGHVDPRPVLCH